MADCTKTVEFLREFYKICEEAVDCNSCMLRNIGDASYCLERVANNTEAAIAIVQTWSDEHPAMTWEGKLRELLPGAKEEALETIKHSFCPSDIFGFGGDGDCAPVEQCKDDWNGEYKEEKK